ncbi:MAG: hypothetical protein M3O70_18330 [Actinomycetota bacterium]|nr:hypothetical protein [Actinomycetota bacterium]
MVKRVDIGGGTASPEGWTNLDPQHGRGKWKRRIEDGIPVADGSLEEARASHLLEHIPAGQPRIDLMNEVHRVLKPGRLFHVVVPLFPSWQSVADPTHVSFWVRESFDYFCRPIANADYDINYWELVSFEVAGGWEARVTLRKPE